MLTLLPQRGDVAARRVAVPDRDGQRPSVGALDREHPRVQVGGGTMLVQVKRYRHTVPSDVVRNMLGTLHHVGAGRGLVVTTSSFGPGAHAFVENKPVASLKATSSFTCSRSTGCRAVNASTGDPLCVAARRRGEAAQVAERPCFQ